MRKRTLAGIVGGVVLVATSLVVASNYIIEVLGDVNKEITTTEETYEGIGNALYDATANTLEELDHHDSNGNRVYNLNEGEEPAYFKSRETK
jgi:hypothetical protein